MPTVRPHRWFTRNAAVVAVACTLLASSHSINIYTYSSQVHYAQPL